MGDLIAIDVWRYKGGNSNYNMAFVPEQRGLANSWLDILIDRPIPNCVSSLHIESKNGNFPAVYIKLKTHLVGNAFDSFLHSFSTFDGFTDVVIAINLEIDKQEPPIPVWNKQRNAIQYLNGIAVKNSDGSIAIDHSVINPNVYYRGLSKSLPKASEVADIVFPWLANSGLLPTEVCASSMINPPTVFLKR